MAFISLVSFDDLQGGWIPWGALGEAPSPCDIDNHRVQCHFLGGFLAFFNVQRHGTKQQIRQ